MKQSTVNLILPVYLLLFSGCAVAKTSLPAFSHTLSRGEFQSAKKLADGQIGRRYTHQKLLWDLQAGLMDRLLKEYESSNAYFNRAEESFHYFDQQWVSQKSAQTSKGILFNDSALPYTGKNYDRIMVNTYKALNFATLNDFQNARIEFNRALQRQNDAKAVFTDKIEALRNRLSKEKNDLDPDRSGVDATLNNPKLDKIINEKYKNLDTYEVYADFINPFTTYIAGLFFWLEGDTPKAVDLLKEAYAMNKDNPGVASDFARAARFEKPSHEMWIIYENGMAPRREEIRIDIPIIFSQSPVKYVGTAFPTIVPGQDAYSSINVSTSDGTSVETKLLASMNNIVVSEFKKELRGIVTREVSRVALKTYFQFEMQKNYGDLAGIAGGIFQALTTAVDLRMWSSLPKNFQLAHLPVPNDHTVTVRPSTGNRFTINIPQGHNNMILYIRIVARGTAPVYDFIKF